MWYYNYMVTWLFGGMLKIVFIVARNARPVLTDTMWLAHHPSIKTKF